jgi:anaerobilin synthase
MEDRPVNLLQKSDSYLKFDKHPQVYNWHHPQADPAKELPRNAEVFSLIKNEGTRRRAFYIHIPFCQTICSFCPFSRAGYRRDEEVDVYVGALIREIEAVAAHPSVSAVPFSSVFIGGGTPSVLSPDQILRIGRALQSNFDLSRVREFSVEFEAKTATADRAAAFREIGANRSSIGVQTFSPKYRDIFNLTAPLDVVHDAVDIMKKAFPYTNVDMLYGMNGQSLDEFIDDIQGAVRLNTTTIDLYPVNNLATQLRLHREFARRSMLPISGNAKFAMRHFAADFLVAAGFKPHNGYSFTRVPDEESASGEPLTRRVKFLYHDIVYGYDGDEFIGVGAGAISQTRRYKISNIENRNAYVKAILGGIDAHAFAYALDPCVERGIVCFPYRGELDATAIDWQAVPSYTQEALDRVCAARLAEKTVEGFRITKTGWLSYVHLMHFLARPEDQALLERRLAAYADEGRTDGDYIAIPSMIPR